MGSGGGAGKPGPIAYVVQAGSTAHVSIRRAGRASRPGNVFGATSGSLTGFFTGVVMG